MKTVIILILMFSAIALASLFLRFICDNIKEIKTYDELIHNCQKIYKKIDKEEFNLITEISRNSRSMEYFFLVLNILFLSMNINAIMICVIHLSN